MNKILIYYTNGICKYSTKQSKIFLEKKFKSPVFISNNLDYLDQYSMICIPGGIGSKFINKLKLRRDDIHNFILNGGTYFGICCGAYLACNNIHFDDFSKKGLNLINVDSYGPLFQDPLESKFNINNPKNIKIKSIYDISIKKNYDGYLHGGGYFNLNQENLINDFNQRYIYKTIKKYNNNKIILESIYDNGSPAIISKRIGNGYLILSHIHPEHEYSNLNDTFKRIFNSYQINLNNRKWSK